MVMIPTHAPEFDPADPFAPVAASAPAVAQPAPAPADGRLCILALDLATTTGWAVRYRTGVVKSGAASFTPQRSWTPGQRWQRFRSFLATAIAEHRVDVIAYEDVRRHMSTDSAHAYGAFLALTEMLADGNRLRLVPVGVGVVKKAWTGRGDATKEAMVAEARRRGFRPQDDNEADALAILNEAVRMAEGEGAGIGLAAGLPDPSQVQRRARPAKAGEKPEAGRAPQGGLFGGAAA